MKTFVTLVCCILVLNGFSQTVPFNINYQGIARDANGLPIIDAAIDATINILQGDVNGPVVFQEEHSTSTNTFGIYLIMIGDGIGSDNLMDIDWSDSDYYIETLIRVGGEPELSSVSKLNSVPYAFLSYKSVVDETEDSDSDASNELQELVLNGKELSLTKGNSISLEELIQKDETVTRMILSADNRSFDYIDEAGVINNINLCHIVDNCESVTSLTYNSTTNSLVYLDEEGVTNNILLNGFEFEETVTTLVDNGNGTFTYTNESGVAFTFGTGGPSEFNETVTSLTNNGDGTMTYVNERGDVTTFFISNGESEETITNLTFDSSTNQLIYKDESGATNFISLGNGGFEESITTLNDNGDGTFSYTNESGDVITFGVNNMPETVTALTFDNSTNRLVYVDENGVTNFINIPSGNGVADETITTIALNFDGSSIDYVDEDGVTTNMNLCGIVDNCETVTSLVFNTATKSLEYIDEDGVTNVVEIPNENGGIENKTTTTIALNFDGSSIDYVDEDGVTTNMNLCGIVDNCETVTSLVFNTATKSLEYIDEDGVTNVVEIPNENGGIENETITTIALNFDGSSIDYVDEDGVTTNMNLCGIVDNCETVTSLVFNTVTKSLEYVNEDGATNSVSLEDLALEETLTSFVENTNGLLTYKDENGNRTNLDANSFIEDDPEDNTKVISYATLSGPEQAIFERGTSQIINGEVFVEFSDHFKKLLASNTMTVSLTPHSADTFGLAVVEKNTEGIRVKELMNGVSNFSFDWEVKATRKSGSSYQVIRNK